MYDEAMDNYMSYVMQNMTAPDDVLGIACAFNRLKKSVIFRRNRYGARGLAPSPLMRPP